MATLSTTYLSDLRTEITHLQSGNKIITDAPVDNQGKGEYFSPTDLFVASLGSCMLTIMGIASKARGFSIDGTKVETTKVMAVNPRRVGEIIMTITFPQNYGEKERFILERAAHDCPVRYSIREDIKVNLTFNYPA